MKWSSEAEKALARVPFFVRKRVRGRVEEEAARAGAGKVEVSHMTVARNRFLNRMEEEVRGYQVEACFGEGGCENRAFSPGGMVDRMEALLSRRDLKTFLKGCVGGPLKMHHEFRVSISDCPNACSRPQIVDVGLIGASRPQVSKTPCSRCGGCVKVCLERAVSLREESPLVDPSRCLACGQCVKVCPTGTLREGERGYRILLGGKLGRHPRLGEEVPGIHDEEETLRILDDCIAYYLEHCRRGERLGAIIERKNFSLDLGQRHRSRCLG